MDMGIWGSRETDGQLTIVASEIALAIPSLTFVHFLTQRSEAKESRDNNNIAEIGPNRTVKS